MPMTHLGAASRGLILTSLIAATLACSTIPATVHRTSEGGEIVQYKRYPKYMEYNLIHHIDRIAYRQAGEGDFNHRLSPQQQAVLMDLGKPELIRHSFKSRGEELVQEWLYLEKQRLYQFVEGMIAYEGPVTDQERILAEHGYPDHVSQMKFEGGGEWVHWEYRVPLSVDMKQFTFSKDNLVYQQRVR